jgi:2-dehydro-3-deoxygalactonokinase
VDEIAASLSTPASDVHIVPGLSCTNRFGATDYMRGEETQILGAVSLLKPLQSGRRLLCLPGTHTKWVVVEAGRVLEFLSAPTGEVYQTLHAHSVLVRDMDAKPFEREAFMRGVAAFNQHPQAQLLHRLFEVRSRQLKGELSAAEAAGFLSGLLIASDNAGGVELAALAGTQTPVAVIGAPALTSLYALALEARGVGSLQLDGSLAALAGLTAVQRQFELEGAT